MRHGYLDKVIPALRRIVNYRGKRVYLDFSEVEDITEGTFMVLLAQVEKAFEEKNKEVYMFKKLPQSRKVLSLLGKPKKVKHQNIRITNDVLPGTLTNQKLDTDFIDELVSELKKIGLTTYYRPFYDFLVEVIGNAIEHGIQKKKINWWLLRYRTPYKRGMTYVFVDMGMGIIKSYKNSGLLRRYTFKDVKKIPLDALYGRLGSSTKEPNRGRGLPQIREIIEKGYISDFVLITNNVSLRYVNGKFEVSKNPNFVGTFFSWTINKENYIQWKNSKS
jgi:hypothetical protein